MHSKKLCVTDLHLHTNLSGCAPADTTIQTYLAHCAEEGIQRIGISNHLYSHRGIDHTLQIRDEIRALQNTASVEILVGCEMELFYDEDIMLQKENASLFDYVMIAPSHIFNKMRHYENFDLSTSENIRKIIIDNFKRACVLDLGVPTAICHPLYPICAPAQQEILDGMTDQMLTECYSMAAEHQKCIEIHACLYRGSVDLDEDGLSPSYIRMLSIAKQCGCRFYFGTDAHRASDFVGRHALLERGAKRAGIGEEDLWPMARI